MKAGPVCNDLTDFQEPIPHTGLRSPSLIQGARRAQSYLNLISYAALLTSMGGISLSEQKWRKNRIVDGVGGQIKGEEGEKNAMRV